MIKLAAFLAVVSVAFMVWCLVEALFADGRGVRRLPKPLWIVVIVLLPLVGGAAWLLSGRPVVAPARSTATPPGRATRNASNPAHEAVDLSTRIRERAEEQRRRYEQQKKLEKDTEQPEAE